MYENHVAMSPPSKGNDIDVINEMDTEICNGRLSPGTSTPQQMINSTARQTPRRVAISVQSVEKSFGRVKVLDKVNMMVEEGTIYGFLGASGSGKTTLLSLVVGLRKMNAGKIFICGKAPGSEGSGVPGRLVGYMPQETALSGEFTIREVCHFFGRLYGMSRKIVNDRVDYLLELLDLTSCQQYIKNMSGGQMRRASFLVALLHEPEILILDEPTVGVDPVLRTKIWGYLRSLVEKFGTTVVTTTHYIEEMRQADRVGIMRHGKILAEGSPQELMEDRRASMLEEAVLKYCLKSDGEDNGQNPRVLYSETTRTLKFEMAARRNSAQNGCYQVELSENRNNVSVPTDLNYMQSSSSQVVQTNWVNRVRALTVKNLTVLIRTLGILLFAFVSPAAVVWVYCYAVGSDPYGLNIGIVAEGGGCQPGTLVNCIPEDLSCAFAYELGSTGTFNLRFYEDDETAEEAVIQHRVWGFISFGSSFSKHFYDRTLGKVNNKTIDGSKILVRLDASTAPTAQFIQKRIMETYQIFLHTLLAVCNIPATGFDFPIDMDNPVLGSTKTTFRDYIAPSVALGFVSFLATLTCGLAFIVEKKDGMIHRTRVAGVTMGEIMLSHFIPQFGVILIQLACCFVLMFVFFDIPRIGSLPLAYTLYLVSAMSGMVLGFMASSILDDEKHAMLFSVAFLLPSFMLTGIVYPLESMPQVFAKVGIVFPGGCPGEAVRSVLLRGEGISDFAVYMGFISPLVYTIIYAIATLIILKIRK